MTKVRKIVTSASWYLNKKMPLYRKYPKQHLPQSAHIELSPETWYIDADFSREIGNSIPAMIWYRRQYRLPIPATLSGTEIAALLQDPKILELVEAIFQGYTIEWNGHNHIGCLSEAAQEAMEHLEKELSRRFRYYENHDYEEDNG